MALIASTSLMFSLFHQSILLWQERTPQLQRHDHHLNHGASLVEGNKQHDQPNSQTCSMQWCHSCAAVIFLVRRYKGNNSFPLGPMQPSSHSSKALFHLKSSFPFFCLIFKTELQNSDCSRNETNSFHFLGKKFEFQDIYTVYPVTL